MTTIATDGNTLAADRRVVSGRQIEPWAQDKILLSGGRIYAYSGSTALFLPWVRWYEGDRDPRKVPVMKDGETLALWAIEDGVLWEVHSHTPYPLQLGYPSAMGSGQEYAYGALAVGASPEEAVRAASRYDPSTGAEVQVVTLSGKAQQPAKTKRTLR